MRKLTLFAAGAILLSSLQALATPPSAPAAGTVGTTTNWSNVGGAADESNFSRLAQITSANVKQLGLAWSLELPGESSLEATPLAVDGVLYFTGALANVYAVDARTGKLLWTYDPEAWKFNPGKLNFLVFPVNRGVAYDN